MGENADKMGAVAPVPALAAPAGEAAAEHTTIAAPAGDAPRAEDKARAAREEADPVTAPALSPLAVFWLFLGFGCRAFGGPTVQIADQREELVIKGKWISEARFNRAFALYQLLPGPEATELACYFGRLAGGRLGGLAGGLGFITPGFLLMLFFAWFYSTYGVTNKVFLSVFKGLQPAMAALLFRAVIKIGDFSLKDHATKQFDIALVLVAAFAAFEAVLFVNYFIAKIHLVLVYLLYLKATGHAALGGPSRYAVAWRAAAVCLALAGLLVFIGVTAAYGRLDVSVPMGVGVANTLGNSQGAQFVVGLMGGLVTFGGAYTAIPFVQYETVRAGGWIVNQVFLDSLAVCSILPTPLVMFVTMVGYASGAATGGAHGYSTGINGLVGALLMTLGMFLPAFIMPVCFGDTLDRAMNATGIFSKVLDAVAATVVGQIAITGLQLLRTAVVAPTDAVIFFAAMHVANGVPGKYTVLMIVAAAGMAGQMLYGDE